MKRIVIVILVIGFLKANSQNFDFRKQNNLVFYDSTNTLLPLAVAGGFNSPQFSEIDLNFDGHKDLFVFDRVGNGIKTFLNDSLGGGNYSYAPSYEVGFPKLENFAYFKDFNLDGKEDIITFTQNKSILYKNTSDSVLAFERIKHFKHSGSSRSAFLTSDYGNFTQEVYFPVLDQFAWQDVDRDSDLDLLVFNASGTTIQYHKNISIESGNSLDSIEYELVTDCWGEFQEAKMNNSIFLGITCKGNTVQANSTRHVGSSMLLLNLDGDKDMDLILGDQGSPNAFALYNNASSGTDIIESFDTLFPAQNPIDISIFPSFYFLDVSGDGVKDLIACPNSSFESGNINNVWYYKNQNVDTFPDFDFVSNRFLSDKMIDVGGNAAPTFVNVNQDSLLDILISNSYIKDSLGEFSTLTYFKNIGTKKKPAFKFISGDFGNFYGEGIKEMAIRCEDLNNDGLFDIVSGEQQGRIFFYKNTGSTASPSFSFWDLGDAIDVGNNSRPELYDFNSDGLLDLVIGESNGELTYIKNEGSPSNPIFNDSNKVELFGKIKYANQFNLGYSSPCVISMNRIGKTNGDTVKPYLLVGTDLNKVYIHELGNDLLAEFNLIDSIIYPIKRQYIDAADLNNDSIDELLVGEISGGLGVLAIGEGVKYIIPKSTFISENKREQVFMFPNPSGNQIQFKGVTNIISELKIYSIEGKNVISIQNVSKNQIIDISYLERGIYIARLIGNGWQSTLKFVKT